MSQKQKSSSRDGRSHRLVALIGFTNAAGQKCLLTLPNSSSLFPGTVFGAVDHSQDEFKHALNRAKNELAGQFAVALTGGWQFVEAETPRAAGGRKFYLIGQVRSGANHSKMEPMPVEQVLERLAAQEDEGRCSKQFIDRVFEAAEALSEPAAFAA